MQILLATEGKWGKWGKWAKRGGGESSRVVQISSNRTWLNWVGFIINGELGEEGRGRKREVEGRRIWGGDSCVWSCDRVKSIYLFIYLTLSCLRDNCART